MLSIQNLYQKARLLLLFIGISVFLVNCSSPQTYPDYSGSHNHQQKVLAIAKAQLGKPYRYGSNNPNKGFDCSGLVNYSYKKAGISVPRTTKKLYNASKPVQKDHLKAGDLVFFRINRHKISHVGLYLGNDEFIHAPSGGKKVDIANMNDRYWRKRFIRGGRI